MALTANTRYQGQMVDMRTGQISREIFVDETIYQEEQEQIFTRAWFFVGHETQVPKPGDYFVSCMGEESVILCRDREGQPCPYHGWSFATDGQLVGVPFFKDAYHEELDKSRWGLVEVAQLATYKGSIWATWDPSAPSFLEYLGDFKIYLDLSLDAWDGREGGTEMLGGVQKWIIPCNWKFPAENFSGDSYHNISHRSVDMVGIGPSGSGRRDMQERMRARRLQICFPDRGHTTGVYILPNDKPTPPSYQHNAVVSEYFLYCEEERRKRRGDWGCVTGSPGQIFPNTALHPRQPRSFAVWHPRGPHQTECWRWYFVDHDAPAEVKNFLREYYIRYSGPGGMTEQDDMENWNYAHAASRGTIARRFPYSYEQGMGYEQHNFEFQGLKLPGVVMDLGKAKSSEQNLRNFYKRWADFMDARDWDELANWRHNNDGGDQSNGRTR